MQEIKSPDSKILIPISMFGVCLIDNLSLDAICKLYTRQDLQKKTGIFKLDKFVFHLKQKHGVSLQDYCLKYLQYEWPKCPVRGTILGYKRGAAGILINRFARGAMSKEFCPAFAAACQKFSEERQGDKNPMWGKEAWNTGLTTETSDILKVIGEKRRGQKMSNESRSKMRQRRAESPIKARHTTKHTEESKDKMRLGTAKGWAEGRFNRVTSIHLKMREFLQALNLKIPFVEEYQVVYFSMDFAFPEIKLAIECQGTYYHIDPRLYPNGPKDAIQRRNHGRDITKRKVCCDREGWAIIEVWETEINDGSFKQDLLCKLKELNLLND